MQSDNVINVSIKEFLWSLLEQWKLMLLVGLAFAFIFPVLLSQKDKKADQERAASEAQYAGLSRDEILNKLDDSSRQAVLTAAYQANVFNKVGLFNTALGRKGNNLMGAEEKDIFDKMKTQDMRFCYLPKMILHHIIPQKKLELDYFNRLTLQIGQSERQRTRAISRSKYLSRIGKELVKWGGTIVLLVGYTLTGTPLKGWKLVLFRRNVTRGLLGLATAQQ